MKKFTFLVLLFVVLCFGQSTIAQTSTLYLTVSGGSFASEKWVDITTGINGTGTVIWAQGNGTYGNGQGYITDAAITVTDGVTYYINCYDRYDDSWDGTTYQLRNAINLGGDLVANNGGISPDDGNDVDATSAWEIMDDERESSEAFTYVPPTCPSPSALSVANITFNTAELTWTENGTATAWDIEIVSAGNTATGTPTFDNVTSNTAYLATGLVASTTYSAYVRADCGQNNIDVSNWSSPAVFDTPCATITPSLLETFTTFPPNCWSEAGDGLPSAGPSILGSSDWRATTMDGGDADVALNLYSNVDKEWVISPNIDLTGGPFQVELDVAVSNWNAPTIADAMGSDDEVQLLISNDNGATWVNLKSWTVADNLPTTATHTIIDLSAYTGVVKFAIWATDGTVDDTEDYDFHFDNFRVRTPPMDDAGLVSINTPLEGFMPGANIPVNVTLKNFGANTLTSATINYTIDDVTNTTNIATSSFSWTGSLANLATASVQIGTFTATPLTQYTITATVVINADADNTNDQVTATRTSALIVSSFPYTENFDAGAGTAPGGWTAGSWLFVNGPVGTSIHGANIDHTSGTGYFAGLDDSNTTLGQMYNLVSPYFDLSASGLSAPTLNFWLQNIETGGSAAGGYSPLHIDIWNGTTWDNDVSVISSKTDAWTEFNVPLTAYASNTDVQIRFRGEGIADFYSDLSIDDISIVDPPQNDAGFTAITNPASTIFAGNTVLNIDGVLTNFGLTALTSANWSWTVSFAGNTVTSGTGNWTGNLSTGSFATIALGTFTANTAGTYTISATSSLPNTNVDGNAANDTYSTTVIAKQIYTAPYSENFTAGYPAQDWSEANGVLASPTVLSGTTSAWTQDDYLNNTTTADKSARFEVWSTNSGWMFTPFIDLGNGSTPYSLDFDLGLTNWSTQAAGIFGTDDRFAVVISTDNGQTWTETNLLVDYNSTHAWSELGEHVSVSLAAYTGIVQIGFFAGSTTSNEDNNVYVDNVKIATPLSNDASLSDLTVSGTTVTGFATGTFDYNVVLPSGTTVVPVVVGTPTNANATAATVAATALPGTSTVTVTAEDGITQQVYNVNFTVSTTVSTDATLSDLTVSGTTVTGFSASTMSYNVVLPAGTTIVPTVVGTPTSTAATAATTDATSLPGSSTVLVTAQDGVTQLTYTVNFTIALNNDATLSDLTIDGTTVTGFASATYDYNVVLPAGTTVVPTVAGVATDNGNAVVFTTSATALPGSSTVLVVAADGVTSLTYTINFTVAVSVNQLEEANIKIFPNPSKGIFNIVSKKSLHAEINDISGKTILIFNTDNKSEFKINTPGMYFIKLSGENTFITKKLIVQ